MMVSLSITALLRLRFVANLCYKPEYLSRKLDTYWVPGQLSLNFENLQAIFSRYVHVHVMYQRKYEHVKNVRFDYDHPVKYLLISLLDYVHNNIRT